MAWLSRLRFRVRTLTGRGALEAQLDEEMQFHLEMQAAAYVRTGMSPLAAHALARREFGSVAQHKDDYRDRWGARRLESLFQDVRAGVREVLGQPTSSLAIVLAIALGVGVSTSVFAVLHGVLLQPPPYAAPERLVRLQVEAGQGERLFSAVEVRDLRAESASLESLAEFHYMYFILLDGKEPRRVSAGVVSANFFDVIGVEPMAGRNLRASDDVEGAPGVIVVSHRFWKNELGGGSDVVGRVFRMNDREHTVVGVLPPLPNFPEEADIYLPTSACPLRASLAGEHDRSMHLVSVLGRVAPGHSAPADTLRADLADAAARIGERFPDGYARRGGFSLTAIPVTDDLVSRFRPTLLALLASAAFLLLSLCSSVGALLTARALPRRPAIALRVALGAWRGRLFQQFAVEALLLTAAGAAIGLLLAAGTLPWLIDLASRYTSRASEIRLTPQAVTFAAAVSLVIAAVCGAVVVALVPRVARPDLLNARVDMPRLASFRLIVVLQLAVSFALLSGAVLTMRSLRNLARVETGFHSGDVVTMRVSTDFIKHESADARRDLFDRLLRAVREVPGVTAAAMSGAMPFIGDGHFARALVEVRGPAGSRALQAPIAVQVVSRDYFRTVGIDLIAGHGFGAVPAEGRVALVNDAMARTYWGGAAPLGDQVRLDGGDWATIIGVVADSRQRLDVAPSPEVFVPLDQMPPVQSRVLVRANVPPEVLFRAVRDAFQRAEPTQPVDSLLTLDQARAMSMAPARVMALLIALFATIAVTISLAGVAGVVNASVNARVRELGVQMALGATRGRVLRSVLGQAMRLAAPGLALGLVLAFVLARALRGLLFGIQPHDAATFAMVAVALVLVTLAACLVPARRAALVDPNVAIRVG